MRLLVAALLLTFALAVTAAIFALWPVVATPPWVSQPTPVVVVQPTVDPCVMLRTQLIQADSPLAINVILTAGGKQRCW